MVIGKTLFKSLLCITLCAISLSCTMLTDSYGNISFNLPNIENTIPSRASLRIQNFHDNKFTVTLRKKNGPIVSKKELPPKSPVFFNKLKTGYYTISLSYEDKRVVAYGSNDVYVKAGKNNSTKIDITYTNKSPIIDGDAHKPETPESGNGDNTLPSFPNNGENVGPDHTSDPDIPSIPETKPDENIPSNPDNVGPEVENPLQFITYYVDGIKGNDWGNNGNSCDTPLRSVSQAISLMNDSGNYIIEVKNSVTEDKLINVNKNINLVIKGSTDGSSKIIRKNGSDLLVVGTANGKATNNAVSIRPTVKLENITLQADTTSRALLVYYGTLQLGEGVSITGKAKTSVQLHVGQASSLYLGGAVNICKSININGNACIKIDKPLIPTSSLITLNLYKGDGKTPNYDTKHVLIKAINTVKLEEEVVKIKLGNTNYKVGNDGIVTSNK